MVSAMSVGVAAELLDASPGELCAEARRLRDEGHGALVTYSPKVFIPLTKLCRDVCHYCTFAHPPRRGERAYLSEDEVLEVARAGVAAGCHEALFTLGDKPELRYRVAREELAALGCGSTLEYLARCARLVLEETGLLPHVNPGVLSIEDARVLRQVSASQGAMLETTADRLSQRGGPHFGSPDKLPARRLETIAAAGEAHVPFTTGILIGIGETRAERIEALLAIRELGERYGHVQEVIVQNFRAKPGTRMAGAPEPTFDELLWTAAAARVVLGPEWNVQVPPNLSYDEFPRLLDAGINDWGGISPVTVDHVNPEAPWPEVERLLGATEGRGLRLAPRLAVYPEYLADAERWLDPAVAPHALRRTDADGLAREDAWAAGSAGSLPRGAENDLGIGTRHLLPGAQRLSAKGNREVSPATDEAFLDGVDWVTAPRRNCHNRSPTPSLRPASSSSSPRTTSPRSSRPAAPTREQSSPRRTRSAGRSPATESPTSSPATSTTRTSATSAAASARSPRAASPRTSAAGRTSSRSRRSPAAPARPGSAARSSSASRAASTRPSPARRTRRSARP
jgi:7,8-didemethyl-8-hydroxy-5-deazariboflavin synthase CofG subunit